MTDLMIDCAIVDDEIVASDRLKDILDDFDSVQTQSVYNTFKEALDNLIHTQPKVIFLDVELDRNHTAFELIDHFHSNCYFPHIILITAFEHYAVKAIKKRVFDYLVKPIDVEELMDTLNRLAKHIQSPSSSLLENNSKLSTREKQVLELVLLCKTSNEIADQLFVSRSTIDTHRKNILRKTGAKSSQELLLLSRV